MPSGLRSAALALFVAVPLAAAQQETKYGLKTDKAEPPKELDVSVRKLLGPESLQFLDPKGGVVAEVWLRKQVPTEAAPEQVKKGVTYRDLPETTILGAIRFARAWKDYRQQKIKPGVYTLRLGFQPQDGDHMGTSPYPEFCLLVAAAEDRNAETLEPKKLQEMSASSIGTTHPAVLLLFPNPSPGAAPRLEAKANEHVVLSAREKLQAKGAEGVLGIGLTLVGHAP